MTAIILNSILAITSVNNISEIAFGFITIFPHFNSIYAEDIRYLFGKNFQDDLKHNLELDWEHHSVYTTVSPSSKISNLSVNMRRL